MITHAELVDRLEAIRDSLGPFLPARETCPCPHCEGWRQLRALITDIINDIKELPVHTITRREP